MSQGFYCMPFFFFLPELFSFSQNPSLFEKSCFDFVEKWFKPS